MFIYFVKEIRQLRRNPVFWIAPTVQIMLSFVIMYLMHKYLNSEDLYSPFYRALGIFSAFIIAINSGMRWSAEKSDDALNPFITTPLPPVRVVAEKYLATAIVVLLPLSIAQLFAAFTAPEAISRYLWCYLLPTDMAAILLSSALILTTASACGKKQGVLGSVLPGVLLLLIIVLGKTPQLGFREFSADRGAALLPVLRMLLPVILLFALTNAAVSPASSDRMLPARLALLLTLAVNIVIVLASERKAEANNVLVMIAYICAAGSYFSVIAAIAERHAQSRRVAAEIRRLPPALRPLRALCSTGAITEVIFSLLLAAAAEILLLCSGDRSWNFPFSYATYLFCAACPLMISCLVKRGSNTRIHPALLYLIAWGIMMILSLVVLFMSLTISDPDGVACFMTAVLGLMSLVMLIPTAQDFVASLKRR